MALHACMEKGGILEYVKRGKGCWLYFSLVVGLVDERIDELKAWCVLYECVSE